MHIEEIYFCLSAHLYGVSLCTFLISHLPDLPSANISSCCSLLTFKKKKKKKKSPITTLNLDLASASGPATPDSAENITQHLSPESSRKAYWRTWDGSMGTQHMPQSPNVFSEHSAGSNMSPGGMGHLKSPAPGRTRSVSDSSAPRRGSCSLSFLFHFHETQTSLVVTKTQTVT